MNKFKNRLKLLGLDIKKEILIALGFSIPILALFVISGLILKQFILIPIGFAVNFILLFLFFTRYKSMERELLDKREQEFVVLFTYFEIYISNKSNVYNALQNIGVFASPFLKEIIDQLIFEIDSDKTVQPFIKFSHNFDTLLIEQLMISIFQMIDQGSDTSYLTQFETIFSKISDQRHELELDKRVKRLEALSICPLIGAGMLTIIITIGIVSIIGGVISGI